MVPIYRLAMVEMMTNAMQNKAATEPLAIVGMACLFPKAANVQEFWSNITNLVDGIGPIPSTHWNPKDYFDSDQKRPDLTYANRGGFLEPYPFQPAEFGIAPRDLEAIDTAQLLGLVVAKKALDDAGLLREGVDRRRISVILGVTGTLEMVVPLGARLGHPLWRRAMLAAGASEAVIDDAVRRIASGYVGWQENSFPGLLGNVVAGRIANRLNLGGTNCVVDAACASSLSALHMAIMELRSGRADAVLTGGVDTFNDIFMFMCFSKTPALSPTGDARPFDANADGTILGEGLGMFVIKRLSDAERNGDRIYAVVQGLGTSSDGAGDAVYAPTVDGQRRCLQDAYAQADISPAVVSLIEAHGTGTKVGDATELDALVQVFCAAGTKEKSCAIGSVKSQIGHTKAAAGAAGMLKAVLALHHGVLPPTAKVKQPAAQLDDESPFYVTDQSRPWLRKNGQPRRAGVSSFGFGGSNYHCVLEEYPASQPQVDWDGDCTIAAFSGSNKAELANQLNAFNRAIDEGRCDWSVIRHQAAESRRTFSTEMPVRLTLVLRRGEFDLASQVQAALTLIDSGSNQRDDVYFSSDHSGRLGVLFPGQGSQYVGMMRDMACRFSIFRDVLAQADAAFAAGLVDGDDDRLSDLIYPPMAFSSEKRAAQEADLRATQIAQPALGAVSLGALQVLGQFGIWPDVAAGHSYGELTALCAAGCYDAPSLFALSQMRGRLMAQESVGDAGAMLAVMAPIQEVEAAVADDRIAVVVANRNAPAQAVLSGARVDIEQAEKTLTRRKMRHVRLPVSAAFHSPMVADAAGPFRSALAPIEFREAQLPVFANSTSREYPKDPQAIRDLLATQLARPVDFVSQIRNMSDARVRIFVEVGPGHTLARLVGAILTDRPHVAFALDSSIGRNPGSLDLARTVARLAALGHVRRLSAWDPTPPPAAKSKTGLVIPICGANYRAPQKPEPPIAIPTVTLSQQVVMAEPEPQLNARSTNHAEALRIAQESLAAFQRLQEQTADLHRTFLEQQTEAQRTLQIILTSQQELLGNVANGNAIPKVMPLPPRPATVASTRPTPQPISASLHSKAMSQNGQTAPAPHKPTAPAAPPPKPKPEEPKQSDLVTVLLDVVAEKTGYPVEMLNVDMGLDADLGIDSIKRVEILSALQEIQANLPAVPPDRLGSLRTLRDVIDILQGPSAAASPVASAIRESLPPESSSQLTDELLEVVADKTGYPVEMLNLDMGLDADLGIDSIKRVEILSALQDRRPDLPAVPPDRLGSLRTLNDVVALLLEAAPEKKANRPAALIR